MKWELRPIDIDDPYTGEPLYVYVQIRPRWYWHLRRIRLFSKIVWRKYESRRITVMEAWEVATIVHEPERPA